MAEFPFSLREATGLAVTAADAGDLDALAQALVDREAAIASASPAERTIALDDGETITRLLTDIKRTIVAEHNRLEQVREGFLRKRAALSIDLQG